MSCIKRSYTVNDGTGGLQIISGIIHHLWDCGTVDEIKECLKKILTISYQNNMRSSQSRQQSMVKRLLDYIEDHYQEDLSLDLLSENFSLSNSYISRLISNHTGKSFLEKLLEVRMKRAEQLLQENQLKISRIAEQVGYHDTSYFIQVFKKYFGMTPNEYRKTT